MVSSPDSQRTKIQSRTTYKDWIEKIRLNCLFSNHEVNVLLFSEHPMVKPQCRELIPVSHQNRQECTLDNLFLLMISFR